MLLKRTLVVLHLVTFAVLFAGCSGETGSSDSPVPSAENQAGQSESVADSTEKEQPEAEETTGTLAPENVKLTKANWEEVQAEVAKHKGKVVVLDIWSTSCQPCLREFPNLVDLSQKYPERVVCLSLNTDYYGGKTKPPEHYEERVRKVLSDLNATFDNYLCTIPSDELYGKIDLGAIPAVFVFGPDGEIAEFFNNDDDKKYGGEFTYAEHIIPKIESLLKPAE